MRDLQMINKVVKVGNSFSVPMAKQLKSIGAKKGDDIYLYCENGKIILEHLENKEE